VSVVAPSAAVRGEAHELLGVPDHVLAILVRAVPLHHRELGVVARRDSLVAEIAVDLVDALDAADDQALQEQLRRDAQVHIHAQRVVVRLERPRHRAAGDRLHHRRLDLEVAVGVHRVAQRVDHFRAHRERAARFRRDDQVDVALAVAHLLVGEPVELLRQWAQRLDEQPQPGCVNRQLALVRLEERAFDSDDVAEIPVLELLVRVGAGDVVRHVDLQATAAVLQRREARLAHDALQHHSPCDRDRELLRF
jgi:hypothetical protein